MNKEDISRAICEIKCVCISPDDECVGNICGDMAENIIKTLEETSQNPDYGESYREKMTSIWRSRNTPQNPEYRFKHLSEEPIG